MTSAPIADLSYRDYDGPLAPPQFRWWVIAKTLFKLNLKKKSFWVFTILSGLYYMVMLTVFFIMDQLSQNSENPEATLRTFMSNISWKDQFLHGFSYGQIWFMFITLLVGAGTIANDNRTNALLVYLSKPCDKKDYLLGKFMGVWLSLLLAMVIPTTFFYLYCGLTYAEYNFFGDKLLLFRLMLLLPIASAFYASVVLGISSIFQYGRFAGATFASVYIMLYFFTSLMSGAWQMMQIDDGARRDLTPLRGVIGNLYYASFDGLQLGLAKGIFESRGSIPFGIQQGGGGPGRRARMRPPVAYPPIPPIGWVLGIMGGLSALSLWIAWRRIRAVEVVQ
jgi:ABC-2 type transport system permease protein